MQNNKNSKLSEEIKKMEKPAWALTNDSNNIASSAEDNVNHTEEHSMTSNDREDGYVETGMEMDIPSNYENNLVNNPKGLTDFEVKKSPGRLG